MAGAGVSLSALIREAAALNLGGIECAGRHSRHDRRRAGHERRHAPTAAIGDFVSAVYFLHPDGTIGEFKPGAGRLHATARSTRRPAPC